MSELPPGWAYLTIADLGGTIGGKTPSKAVSAYWTNGTVPWTSPKDMKSYRLRDSEDKINHRAITAGGMRLLPKESVLVVTRSGILSHMLPVAIAGIETTINQDIKAVLPSEIIEPRVLAYALRAFGGEILDTCSKDGTTVASVETEKLERFPLPTAPCNEQKRIADKLDRLLARVDAAKARLDKIPAILKRLRQSIIVAATSGELTEEWRSSAGLDGGWRSARLADIANSRLGKMLDKEKNKGAPAPYLRNINVRWFGFDLSDIQLIRVSVIEASELAVCRGDVLVCEGGEPGRCAVWNGEDGRYVYQKALHRVRVGDDLLPEWLCYQLKAAADSGALAEMFTGTTIKHLTGVALSGFEVLLPRMEEQNEIVRRVEELFAIADRIEAQYHAARASVERLTQSLLAKAFRGELVPQDPNDEPASAFLARIRTQRAATPVEKRGRKRPGADFELPMVAEQKGVYASKSKRRAG